MRIKKALSSWTELGAFFAANAVEGPAVTFLYSSMNFKLKTLILIAYHLTEQVIEVAPLLLFRQPRLLRIGSV